MSRFVLYSTDCCHLCDLAMAIIEPIATELNVIVEVMDIAQSDELFDRYSLTIPVLSDVEANIYLNWPFEYADVKNLLVSAI